MNVIDYITITCNLKNVWLQITFDYMKNVIDYNRLQLQIMITPCLCITILLFHPWLRPALAELKLHKMYSFYSKYIDMNACVSSKIYTFIIILLHAKCIILGAPHFSPGLGTGFGGVQVFCFFVLRIVHIYTESLLSTSTVIGPKKKYVCLRSPDPPYFSATDPNLFYQQLFHPNFCYQFLHRIRIFHFCCLISSNVLFIQPLAFCRNWEQRR